MTARGQGGAGNRGKARAGRLALCLALSGLLAGCQLFSRDAAPELRVLYEPAAQQEGPGRNPVIVIPGILGTRLVEEMTGRTVWGAFDRGFADPRDPADAALVALPVETRPPAGQAFDTVRPDGVLDRIRVRLIGVPFEIQAYIGILSSLGAGGYRDETLGLAAIDYGDRHFTCFQFAYDWRRDNVENARRLKAFIVEKRAYVQAEYARRFGLVDAPIKFDIVAHSMGGLITRYFLMYGDQDLPADGSLPSVTWAGARDVDRAILIGTPNAGAVDAFRQLIEGKDLGLFLPYYPPALIGTFPSVYQLLPRPRHEAILWDGEPGEPVTDLFDPALWQRQGWGLAAADQADVLAALMPDIPDPSERRRRALALQADALQRAEALMAALDRPVTAPPGLDLSIVAGDAKDTASQLAIDRRTGKLRVLRWESGDGTVLRSSALLDERVGGQWQPTLTSPVPWRSVLFLFSNHIGLTKDPVFTDNVLFKLLEEPRTVNQAPPAAQRR